VRRNEKRVRRTDERAFFESSKFFFRNEQHSLTIKLTVKLRWRGRFWPWRVLKKSPNVPTPACDPFAMTVVPSVAEASTAWAGAGAAAAAVAVAASAAAAPPCGTRRRRLAWAGISFFLFSRKEEKGSLGRSCLSWMMSSMCQPSHLPRRGFSSIRSSTSIVLTLEHLGVR